MPSVDEKPAFIRHADSLEPYNTDRPCQGHPSVPRHPARPLHRKPTPSFGESRDERIAPLVDTPNLFRSTKDCLGDECEPDYPGFLSIARSRGTLIDAFALVNDGYPQFRVKGFERIGYRVLFSEGRDCDFRFVDQAIAMHARANIFLLCSGDHRFANLATVLRAIGKFVIVYALRSCCSHLLIRSADEFIPLPIKQRGMSAR
jgi:hypothetical protein